MNFLVNVLPYLKKLMHNSSGCLRRYCIRHEMNVNCVLRVWQGHFDKTRYSIIVKNLVIRCVIIDCNQYILSSI